MNRIIEQAKTVDVRSLRHELGDIHPDQIAQFAAAHAENVMVPPGVSVKPGSCLFGAYFLYHTDPYQGFKDPVDGGSGDPLELLFHLVKEFIRTGVVVSSRKGFEDRLPLRGYG